MTEEQKLNLQAFNNKKDYISVLAKRGYNGEKLTKDEIFALLNARDNLMDLVSIWDLNEDTKKELDRIIIDIINVPEIKEFDHSGKLSLSEDKITSTESTLSVAIKKELHNSVIDGTDKAEKYISDRELQSMWEARETILANSITNSMKIYMILGGKARILSTLLLVLLTVIVSKLLYPVIPFIGPVLAMQKMVCAMCIMLTTFTLIIDFMYINIESIRDMLVQSTQDGNMKSTIKLASPQAIETVYLLEKQGVKR